MKKLSVLFGVAVLLLLSLNSCEKENHSGILSEQQQASSEQVSLPLDLPEVKDDLLVFRDVAHFESFYTKLNELYDKDDQKFNAVTRNLGINSVSNNLEDHVFASAKDRYQPFLSDPVMMTIVNEHFEFQIATVLHTYITNEIILVNDIDDFSTRKMIQLMPKGMVPAKASLPSKAYPISDDDFMNLMGPWGSEEYSKTKFTSSWEQKSGSCEVEGSTNWEFAFGKFNPTLAIGFRTSSYKSWGRTYEEAKIYGYKFENGEWKNKDSDISASIWGSRRKDDCIWDHFESEQQSCSSCKNKRARVNKWGTWRHNSTDVSGQYRRIINGSNHEIILESSKVIY